MNYDTLIIQPLRDMTTDVVGFIPTLLTALGVLIIGWVIAKVLRDLVARFFSGIEFDTLTDKLGITGFLKHGGIKQKPSELIGCLTYIVFVIMTLIITVKAFGLTIASDLIGRILAYVPHVISGVMALIIGMYLARFVSVLVYMAAKNTDMPVPATLSRLTKLAIMVYVGIIFLKEVGFVTLFVGTHYTIFIGGVVFALALSFGLAGKDVAAKYLSVLHRKPTK